MQPSRAPYLDKAMHQQEGVVVNLLAGDHQAAVIVGQSFSWRDRQTDTHASSPARQFTATVHACSKLSTAHSDQ